jgi:hypothetical protein
MPIGSVDYVSTDAWNDPYNPWPAYAQLTLSAADTNLHTGAGAPLIMELIEFYPGPGDEHNWVYASLNAEGDTVFMRFNKDMYNAPFTLNIQDSNGTFYYLTTANRSVPAGYVQGNTAWIVGDQGADVTSLSIVPVTTWLNPWEQRRRRSLEYV